MRVTEVEISRRFDYHAPTEEAIRLHQLVRDEGRAVAEVFSDLPSCREQSLALTKLEEAVYYANAAIAREISAPANAAAGAT